MNRRELMMAGGIAGVAMAATGAAAQTAGRKPNVDRALYNATFDCIKIAETCLAHCQALLATGDTMLKDCSKSVAQLIPVCQTLASLTAQESKLLKQYAKLAIEFCNDCERECRKHEAHHAQCKECADGCAACSKECKRVAA